MSELARQLAAAPRTSIEKLEDGLDALAALQGEDTTQRILITTLKSLIPTLRRAGYIPSDAAELDDTLLIAARFALGLRSDAAWQPESIDDLFLGPQPGQDAPEEG